MLKFIKNLFILPPPPRAKSQYRKLTAFEIRVMMARRRALKALQEEKK